MANKKTGDIEIGGRLFNTATGNIVAGADAIQDDNQGGKTQQQINTETYEHVADINAALQELSPDQVEALRLATDVNTLKAKSVRSDEVQSLTATEKARALANLGIAGIDDEPTAGSDNLVKSRGVAEIEQYPFLGDTIFTIKKKKRDLTTGKLVDYYNSKVTPLINLDNIGYINNGIAISKGTFRGSDFGVAFFFDANKEFISADTSTTTYSSAQAYPASSIPVNAKYVSFLQYNNQENVRLKYYGAEYSKSLSASLDSLNIAVNAKLDKKSVKNTLGSSTTDVLSQKVVSDNFNDINNELNGYISSGTKSFPASTYVNYEFPVTKTGDYYVVFSGATVNGNVNIMVNDGGTINIIIQNINPFANGNEIHFTATGNSLQQIIVYIPHNLAELVDGSVTVSLYHENVKKDISELNEDVEEINDRLDELDATDVVLKNLIIGDFSESTSFIFHNSFFTYSISDGKVTITNVSRAGACIDAVLTNAITGHKYYMSAMMKSGTTHDLIAFGISSSPIREKSDGSNTEKILSIVYKHNSGDMLISPYFSDVIESKNNTTVRSVNVIDLTACFGAGNEPSKEYMDSIILSLPDNYIDGYYVLQDLSSKTIYDNKVSVNDALVELGMVGTPTEVINPSMDFEAFRTAINNAWADYATLNKVYIESFQECATPDYGGNWERLFALINKNFREDVYKEGKSMKQLCLDINNHFTKPIYRFSDAKVGGMRDWSLTTGVQSDEPSAIVSEDGSTLYIYAHLKRFHTTDGVNWSEPIYTPITGSVTYLMHNVVNYIDGVYYLIGCSSNSGGGLYLCTSTDGINFVLRGKLFDAGYEFRSGKPVVNWGNSYLLKEPGGNKWYLYIETQSTDESWVINLAICDDILHANQDGTIGDWDVSENRTILIRPFDNLGIIAGSASSSAGNPDFARGIDNRPIKYNGKYYMYFHSTWKGIAHILRASSVDLKNWEIDGVCLDNRDEPSSGDTTSGNADHTLIEFKGRTYMFYTWNINASGLYPYIKYTVDDRRFTDILSLRP